MRAHDHICVVRYNREGIRSALVEAGKVSVDRLENGFDMYSRAMRLEADARFH